MYDFTFVFVACTTSHEGLAGKVLCYVFSKCCTCSLLRACVIRERYYHPYETQFGKRISTENRSFKNHLVYCKRNSRGVVQCTPYLKCCFVCVNVSRVVTLLPGKVHLTFKYVTNQQQYRCAYTMLYVLIGGLYVALNFLGSWNVMYTSTHRDIVVYCWCND
jgi:hypothetical protein